MKTFLVQILALTLSFTASAATETIKTAKIRKVAGNDYVVIQRGSDKYEGVADADLEPGDRIITDQYTRAVVEMPNKVAVLVGENSDFEITQSKMATNSGNLRAGFVRGTAAKVAAKKKSKFKLMIRTRTATMGVRGTDAVVETDKETGSSEFYTLSGKVDVASNESNLQKGKSTKLNKGKKISAHSKKKVDGDKWEPFPADMTQPKPFDLSKFLADKRMEVNAGFHEADQDFKNWMMDVFGTTFSRDDEKRKKEKKENKK